eukprot:12101361-Heterocapsa_arctica.AAC.1
MFEDALRQRALSLEARRRLAEPLAEITVNFGKMLEDALRQRASALAARRLLAEPPTDRIVGTVSVRGDGGPVRAAMK